MKVKPIQHYDLLFGPDKISDEFFLRIMAGINFRNCPRLSMRSKDQIDSACPPLQLSGLPGKTFEKSGAIFCCPPFSFTVKNVFHESAVEFSQEYLLELLYLIFRSSSP
ncbi:MAG: hypothetical protein M1431_00125 [Candidatus Thermoplasmatota archaeon]|nr:hypothetical protein [Candidatus Thermoplasmatota archaeon]